VKKNLFDIDYNNSSGDMVLLKSCDPCSTECKKINSKINGRKLSELKEEEVPHILSLLMIKTNFHYLYGAHGLPIR
jgi:hypothetical protein